ncbi:DUF6302 family protein [Streptomyces sp. NBC_01411]|uniref:DUF6302 family protein n=1 Tax=Streptomyces sp. NBC_01411 TaxID=2903857 RepID=UPI00386BEED5
MSLTATAHRRLRRVYTDVATLAHDYTHYAAHLSNPELLQASRAVVGLVVPILAVPCGGQRRAGCIVGGPRDMTLGILAALRREPGFDNVRSLKLHGQWAVGWGEPEPVPGWDRQHPDRLRFYGYTDAYADGRGVAPAHGSGILSSPSGGSP